MRNRISENTATAETDNGTGNGYDPFDPVNLRLDQAALTRGAAKKLLTTVPVRKPNRQDFFRTHPSHEYRLTAAFIELKEDRETYLVAPAYTSQLIDGEFFAATLYLVINRQKVVSLWPVKLPGADGRQNNWHVSAAEAAEKAIETWTRLSANMSLGAYEIYAAEANFPDPEWPELEFKEILRIGFKNRIIENGDHPVIQKLRGIL
jgi:hypothetical protein